MSEIIFLIEEADDGGFIAKGLNYGIYTDADTVEELRNNIRDAVACHFDENETKPSIIRLHFVRDELLVA